MTFYPPLLSLLLGAAELTGVDAIIFARGLNAACLGLQTLLVGGLALSLTHSRGFALLAGLLAAATGEMRRVHAWLMSEPLFIVLVLAGVLALVQYRQRKHGWALVLGAIALGLAALTRYAGLAIPIAGVIYLGLDPLVTQRRRVGEMALALGLLPSVVWMARNFALTGQPSGRVLGVHLEAWPWLRDQFLGIVLNWFAPLRLIEWIMDRPVAAAILSALVGAGAVAFAVALVSRRTRQTILADRRLSGILLISLCILSYLGSVALAVLFSWPGADVDERMLSPVYPLALLIVVAALAWLWARKLLALPTIVILLALLLVRNKVVYDYWTVRELRTDGLGYASNAWQSSETMRNVVELAPDVIYTNDIAAIYLLANRPSYVVPWALPDYNPATPWAGRGQVGGCPSWSGWCRRALWCRGPASRMVARALGGQSPRAEWCNLVTGGCLQSVDLGSDLEG
jgi:hypothetical protein